MGQQRDYAAETQDNSERRYVYDFDGVLRQYMIRAFQPFLLPGPALELGCFEGDFTTLLAPLYQDLTAVDVVHEAIAINRERVGPGVTYVEGTIEQVQLRDKHYNAVFLVHVLEHVDDPVSILQRIGNWLSPDGRLFVACPNANAVSRQIAVRMGLISHATAVTPAEAAHGHRRTYSLDTLERDARSAGMSILHRGGVFFKPLANFQFDRLMQTDIISREYLEGCYELGMVYPDQCASVWLVCTRGTEKARAAEG